jgi:hypothetical protein
VEVNWTIESALLPVMAGYWFEAGEPDRVRFRGSLFAGAVFASADLAYRYTVSPPPLSLTSRGSASFEGTGWALELAGQVSAPIGGTARVFAELGYQFAGVSRMKASRSADFDGNGTPDVRRGEPLERHDGSGALPFDYGGLRARAGVSLGFGSRTSVKSW